VIRDETGRRPGRVRFAQRKHVRCAPFDWAPFGFAQGKQGRQHKQALRRCSGQAGRIRYASLGSARDRQCKQVRCAPFDFAPFDLAQGKQGGQCKHVRYAQCKQVGEALQERWRLQGRRDGVGARRD
jgi:hypothetical protein